MYIVQSALKSKKGKIQDVTVCLKRFHIPLILAVEVIVLYIEIHNHYLHFFQFLEYCVLQMQVNKNNFNLKDLAQWTYSDQLLIFAPGDSRDHHHISTVVVQYLCENGSFESRTVTTILLRKKVNLKLSNILYYTRPFLIQSKGDPKSLQFTEKRARKYFVLHSK